MKNKIRKNMVVEMLRFYVPQLSEADIAKIVQVPFYGDLYQLTYNHVEANVEDTLAAIKAVFGEDVQNKRIAEQFSGVGVMSYALSEKIDTSNRFYALDIDHSYYKKKFPGMKYVSFDVCSDHVVEPKFDAILTDTNNKSHCLLDVEALRRNIDFMRNSLVKGGLCNVSYIPYLSDIEEGIALKESPLGDPYIVEYDTAPERYLGKTVQWFQLQINSYSEGTQTYYDALLVFNGDSIDTGISEILCNMDGYTVNMIPDFIVDNLMGHAGFSKVPNVGYEGLFFYQKL